MLCKYYQMLLKSPRILTATIKLGDVVHISSGYDAVNIYGHFIALFSATNIIIIVNFLY